VHAVVDGQPSNAYVWRAARAEVHNASRADGGSMDELPTDGGTRLVFRGRNLGAPSSVHPIEASAIYSAAQRETTFLAVGCAVNEAYTRLECMTAAGLGEQLVWKLFVDGDMIDAAAVMCVNRMLLQYVEPLRTFRAHPSPPQLVRRAGGGARGGHRYVQAVR